MDRLNSITGEVHSDAQKKELIQYERRQLSGERHLVHFPKHHFVMVHTAATTGMTTGVGGCRGVTCCLLSDGRVLLLVKRSVEKDEEEEKRGDRSSKVFNTVGPTHNDSISETNQS